MSTRPSHGCPICSALPAPALPPGQCGRAAAGSRYAVAGRKTRPDARLPVLHTNDGNVTELLHPTDQRRLCTRHSGASRNLGGCHNSPSFRRKPESGRFPYPASFRPKPESERFPYSPSFRRKPESSATSVPRHSGASRNPGIPNIYRHPDDLPPVIPAPHPSFRHPTRHSGTPPVIPAPHPSFRHPTRHSGTPPVIPAPHPSFRHPTRHSGTPPVIPAPHPSFRHPTRHSGASRNLAPPLHSTFRRSNGQPAKPPEKSAIFSDATLLPTVHKCGTLAISKSGNPASGSNVPPKANPAAKVHRRPNPTGPRLSPKAKSIGRKIGQPSRNRVQDNTAKTVGIATIVGSGTHSALFHGGVSGHAAGVPTALCRSSNGPGHGKLGHEILQAK